MRRLIINADDFGLTSGVNRAIAEGARAGTITSATIMANAAGFEEAVSLSKSMPRLKTGCHVVLIDGQPVSGKVQSLTMADGRFRNSLKDFAWAAVRGKIAADEILQETEEQIRRIQARGVSVTHVDSHKHTHIFPQVLRPMLRAAKARGVRAVRNPFEPGRSRPAGTTLAKPSLWLRFAGVSAFTIFAAEFRRAIAEEDMATTDGTVGITMTGKLDQTSLLAMLDALPEGTWELVCHPGYADADLQASGTRLTRSREVELEALTSVETRDRLDRLGIRLISYADLKE